MSEVVSFSDCGKMNFEDVEMILNTMPGTCIEVDNGKEIRIMITDGSEI